MPRTPINVAPHNIVQLMVSHSSQAHQWRVQLLLVLEHWLSGSYQLSVGDDVLLRGNHFDDATIIDTYDDDTTYLGDDNTIFVHHTFNKHEFCYYRQPSEAPPSFAVQPTSNPTDLSCDNDDEFEYRIQIRTHARPSMINWKFELEDGTIIENVEKYE